MPGNRNTDASARRSIIIATNTRLAGISHPTLLPGNKKGFAHQKLRAKPFINGFMGNSTLHRGPLANGLSLIRQGLSTPATSDVHVAGTCFLLHHDLGALLCTVGQCHLDNGGSTLQPYHGDGGRMRAFGTVAHDLAALHIVHFDGAQTGG